MSDWIDVAIALPKDGESVIVTYEEVFYRKRKRITVRHTTDLTYTVSRGWLSNRLPSDGFGAYGFLHRVVAWQSFPQPLKNTEAAAGTGTEDA